ncbi:putative ubiquitin carboxyl-terminal hydrolase [Hypoxylon sp. FL1284]|nr:putative ubiquitin carboxyl-terminal hydrolase [Hypoxylon sp. FL1284]
MEQKRWVVLENNPEVMNQLAATLGLSPELAFHDVWSLDEPEVTMAHIPRPALALLVILPLTPGWAADRRAEDARRPEYAAGPEEQVLWFKQTIGNACGSIGLLHCAVNGGAAAHILPGSDLERIRNAAAGLKTADERAGLLYHDAAFEAAHAACAPLGDSVAPGNTDEDPGNGHFVAFVKAGGRLWELEGSRKGPLDRGALADDEDVLSPRALELGFRRIVELGGGDLRFSCIALAKREA